MNDLIMTHEPYETLKWDVILVAYCLLIKVISLEVDQFVSWPIRYCLIYVGSSGHQTSWMVFSQVLPQFFLGLRNSKTAGSLSWFVVQDLLTYSISCILLFSYIRKYTHILTLCDL